MIVSITFKNNYGAVPYSAASVISEHTDTKSALEDAFGKTQNVFCSWSEKPAAGVTVCHHNFDGTPLRSSMVGDEFTVFDADGAATKFEVARIGFKEVA